MSIRIGLTLALALAVFATSPAAAQTAPSQPAGEGGLEEIIITARKREESLQDAPIQVTALSKERIEQFDATSLEKIAGLSPQLFGSYATLDLSAHIGAQDGLWDLALIAKNLTNELIVSGGGDAPNTPLAGQPFADQIGLASNPRTIALQLTFKY